MLPRVATPEGRKLERLMGAVPPVPSLGDYPELRGSFSLTKDKYDDMLGIDGVVPRVEIQSGRTMLIYSRDKDDKSKYCPPDALSLSTAVYIWLSQDDSDQRVGRQLPPLPAALAREMSQGFGVGLILSRRASSRTLRAR